MKRIAINEANKFCKPASDEFRNVLYERSHFWREKQTKEEFNKLHLNKQKIREKQHYR